jgi:hypothetical protein
VADQELTFAGWARERIAQLATGVQDGRPKVESAVTLTGTAADGAPTGTAGATVRFLLAGPADVIRLEPGAIVKRYPTPGTLDHESDRCPHVEFADATLPWRYTPAPRPAAAVGNQHPWLVLVVGADKTGVTVSGNQATLAPAVQKAHPLGAPGDAYPWAHVQQDTAGRRVARLLAGPATVLSDPAVDYVAALVPAFDGAGQPRWNGTGGPVTVPLYDSWRFRVAKPLGSFEDLAALLEPGLADQQTGQAPLDYPRVPAAGDLTVRGALAPLGAGDAALPDAVHDDLDGLRTPARDSRGRPIVGLPRYGEAWRIGAPEGTTWGASLNTDPRDRGVAGLGLELGVRLQEELAAEAATHQGALAEARQRVGHLVLGLSAAGSLWKDRMPAAAIDALWLLGPGLGRVVTPSGTVRDLATAADRPLPRGLFSSAARRMMRTGPARTTLTAAGRAAPGEILRAANRCPRVPGRSDDGLPLGELGIGLEELEERRRRALEGGDLDLDGMAERAAELADQAHPKLRDFAVAIAGRLADAAARRSLAPWAEALGLLVAAAAADDRAVERLLVAMRTLLARWPQPAGDTDLGDLLGLFNEPRRREPPCRPVDLDGLAAGVLDAYDPTGVTGPARVRVLATITGLDPAQPLAPPEVCVGLDRPVWSDVRDQFDEWLLPGVGQLPENSVIAVETNPRFVDALLVGLNTQVLGELRWRNIPVATGCTPLKEFWRRRHTTSGDPIDDIIGVHAWPDGSALGSAAHRPVGASGRDLVIVVRGQLFLRYPSTVVYLITAVHAGVPDFTVDPDPVAAHVLPTFQGRIGTDVTFFGFQGFNPDDVLAHWLVFEEPPAGYRFANDRSTSKNPVTWAKTSFAQAVRVLIRGDRLDPEG